MTLTIGLTTCNGVVADDIVTYDAIEVAVDGTFEGAATNDAIANSAVEVLKIHYYIDK